MNAGQFRRVALFSITSLVVLLGSCGIPLDENARAIDESAIPEQLTSTESTTPTQGPSDQTATIYFMDGTALVRVAREVDDNRNGFEVLNALLAGVREDSPLDEGLTSSVNQLVELLSVGSATDRVVELEFNNELVAADGPTEIQGFAQIVHTITELPGIDGVLFRVDGNPQPATIAGGDIVDRPVTRDDYPAEEPTRPAPSTTVGPETSP